MERLNSPLLINIFKKHRLRLNALFSVQKQKNMSLSEESFAKTLVAFLEPLADKIKNFNPEIQEKIILEIYSQTLLLFAKNILGNQGKYPDLEEILQKLSLHFWDLLDKDNCSFFALLANALLNLSQSIPHKLKHWQDQLLSLPSIPSLDAFQNYGFITAWLSGMAHYRPAALVQLESVSLSVFTSLFQLDGLKLDEEKKRFILNQMVKNPWLTPRDILSPPTDTSVEPLLYKIGNFTGLDGKFHSPPLVFTLQEEIMVQDQDDYFTLFADCFGQTLIKRPAPQEKPMNDNSQIIIDQNGDLTYQDQIFPQKQKFLFPLSSRAFFQHTLGFTSSSSYQVFVVGIKEAAELGK